MADEPPAGKKVHPSRAWVAPFAAAVALQLGCTQGLRGVPFEGPARTGIVVASARTTEPGGLVVLWNGQTAGAEMEWHAWIAGSPDAYRAVWSAAALGQPPAVDFARYVVIAEAGAGGVCNPKITGVVAEASGRLALQFEPDGELTTCILVATRIARIIAVPRRVLPSSVVFLNGHAFEVPEVPFG